MCGVGNSWEVEVEGLPPEVAFTATSAATTVFVHRALPLTIVSTVLNLTSVSFRGDPVGDLVGEGDMYWIYFDEYVL